jgi:hypothetical protein
MHFSSRDLHDSAKAVQPCAPRLHKPERAKTRGRGLLLHDDDDTMQNFEPRQALAGKLGG